MPKLMEKKDWMQTVADVGSAEGVWYENVSVDGGFFQLSAPDSGEYRVILVKVGSSGVPEKPRQKSARELIGYGRKFDHVYRSTAEVMRKCTGSDKERPIADVLIGAYAMQKGGLITRNEADFKALYPNLTIFNPVSSAS